jgi:hypothetical protein
MSEFDHQSAVIQWANLSKRKFPELGLLFAVPNGRGRSKAEAGRCTAEGVRAGIPDLVLPVARGSYHGLFIEMKDGVKGRASSSQITMREALEKQGNCALICRSVDEAIVMLKWYLAGALPGVQPFGPKPISS